MKDIEFIKPKDIEKRSFEIIAKELGKRGIELPKDQDMVTRRVIHTSADFDYAETMKYSRDAVRIAKDMLKNGADIVTDTNMALSGINKKTLAQFGGSAHCFMADEDVEKAANIKKDVIFAIGNAPTALIRLFEMKEAGIFTPKFIIGVPVGFVNVESSKELFLNSDVPFIINKGRKGGSNVAAAICNALLYELCRECL